MARLNDPPSHPAGQHPAPPSTSSTTIQDIDALKRRFTRQNRELARTNSAQSLRIRNLETEIARLLAENIALREAAITAQREAERWQRQGFVAREVVAMKQRLERKLAEVSVLVQELGVLGVGDDATARKRMSGDKEGDAQNRERLSMEKGNVVAAGVESPDQKDWRNRQTLGGVLINGTMASGLEQEGRLPPIVEDKLYPRRTLDLMEVQALNDKGSPDIGPPPVAQFDAIDRGSWDEAEVQESPRRTEADATTGERESVALPNNLETRRKRRTSSLLSEMTTPSAAESDTPALFKSGAKRKLEVSELDEPAPPVAVAKHNDDFVYQRRPTLKAAGRKSGRFSRLNGHQQGDIIIPATGERLPQKDQAKGTERRALAPKSSNSPTKKITATAAELKSLKGEKDGIDESNDTRDIPTRPRVSVVRTTSNATLTNAAKQNRQQAQASKSKRESDHNNGNSNDKAADSGTQPPPKTPFSAADAVLSPPSTSTEPPSSKHNPKGAQQQEAALINSVEDVLNGSIGRASRRARAAVSYTEPNLRDKMRRPGKELVSAVEGIDRQKHREASVGGGGGGSAIKAAGESTLPNAKNMAMSNMHLKEEPASPLSDKKKPSTIINNDSTGDADCASGGAVKRKKNERTSVAKGRTDAHHDYDHHNHLNDVVADAVLAKEIDRLSIFDLSCSTSDNSSLMELKRNGLETTTTTTAAGGSRPSRPLSRRQSVAHSGSNEALVHGRKGSGSATALKQAGSGGEATTGPGADRLATRRRSMMI